MHRAGPTSSYNAPPGGAIPDLAAALADFFSQPFGVVGAVCIMLAVTAFNSRWLQGRLHRAGMKDRGTALLLNGLNLVGGICLLINAVLRQEIVWEVLEVYFVAIAIKGIVQALPSEPRPDVTPG